MGQAPPPSDAVPTPPPGLSARAVDLSRLGRPPAPVPDRNRAERRAMAKGATAGRAADVLLTRTGAMVWLGIKDRGAAKVTPDEGRELARQLVELCDLADENLSGTING
jgi:hypothetical protein